MTFLILRPVMKTCYTAVYFLTDSYKTFPAEIDRS